MRPETVAFAAHLRDRRSHRTVRTYTGVLDEFLSFLRESDPSSGVPTARAIERFLARPLKAGGRRSAATRNQELAALRAYSALARREGMWRTDPTDGVPFVREPPHDPAVLSVFELRRLFFVASEILNDTHRARALAILALLSQLGLRVHELVALDIDQIDTQSATLLAVHGKGGTVHDLPLNAPTAALVLAWLAVRKRIADESESALFVSSRGTRLSIRSVEHLISDLRIRMGTSKRVTPHTLRHSAATLALTMGVDVSTVAEILRHSDLNTTRGYLGLVDARRREAVQKLAIAIPPALVPAPSLEDGAIPRACETGENRLDDQHGLDANSARRSSLHLDHPPHGASTRDGPMDKQKSTDRALTGAAFVVPRETQPQAMATNAAAACEIELSTGGLLALALIALLGLVAGCDKEDDGSPAAAEDAGACTLPEEPDAAGASTGPQNPAPGEFGSDCSGPDSCDSKICVTGTPGRCSKLCDTAADCPALPDWSCVAVNGQSVCVCPHPQQLEECDGVDNDCDGVVDEVDPKGGSSCASREVCESGQCVCPPEKACGDSCVDKAQDTEHCGECGNACVASPGTLVGCLSGVCSTIDIIATEDDFPHHLAVARGFLYWAKGDAVRRIPLPGSTPETVVDGQVGLGALALGTDRVCWTQLGSGAADGRVSCAVDSGTITTLADAEHLPAAVAIDGDRAYWTTNANGVIELRTAPVAGSAGATTLASSEGGEGDWLGVGGDSVYWLGSTGVWGVAKTGGEPLLTVPGQASDGDLNGAFALDGGYLYFSRTATGAVWRVALPAGEPEVFAKPIDWVTGIAVDAAHVYWLDDDQRPRGLRRARKDCPLVEVMATVSTVPDQWSTNSGVYGANIATDDDRVYWATQDRYLLSVRKQ